MPLHQITDGEWTTPITKGYHLACCECGLTHALVFRVLKGSTKLDLRKVRVQFKATRIEQTRPAMKKTTANWPLRSPSSLDELAREGRTYRLRAPSIHHVTDLLLELPQEEFIDHWRIEDRAGYCFCQLTLKTLTLDQVRAIVARVEDGEMMLQTVQPWEKFTGKRDRTLTPAHP